MEMAGPDELIKIAKAHRESAPDEVLAVLKVWSDHDGTGLFRFRNRVVHGGFQMSPGSDYWLTGGEWDTGSVIIGDIEHLKDPMFRMSALRVALYEALPSILRHDNPPWA